MVEKLVMHVGHNCIDRGQNGKKPCEQLSETIEKSIKNLKPQRVAVCKTTPVKNVFFCRDQNYTKINIFDDALDNLFGYGWYISLVKN